MIKEKKTMLSDEWLPPCPCTSTALLTQSQIADKYGVQLYEVSIALREASVEPEGETPGKKRPLKTYCECDAVAALLRYFEARKAALRERADDWGRRATAIEQIVLKDQMEEMKDGFNAIQSGS